MSILALVANFAASNTGRGGHYYSFATIVSAYKHQLEPLTIFSASIGDFEPKPLKTLQENVHIRCSLGQLTSGISVLERYCRAHDIRAIHAYDTLSAVCAVQLSHALRIPYVVTKCGGPPQPFYYPVHDNLIVFSRADKKAMLSRCARPRRIWVLPGRVSPPTNAPFQPDSTMSGDLVIGRVGRIGPTYRYAISSSILLVRELKSRGISARLVVVGHVEDPAVYEELKQQAGNDAEFIVDDSGAADAHKRLPTFSAVIATGRGAHEALAQGIPTFCAFDAERLPLFVNARTIAAASKENFSSRFTPNASPADLLEDFTLLVSSTNARSDYANWAKEYFKRFYSVEKTAETLGGLYRTLTGYATFRLLIYSRWWLRSYVSMKFLVGILRRRQIW